jgi:hypothetical protein
VARSTLLAHCGARIVSREELDRIDAPPPTETWFPVRHSEVIDTVVRSLAGSNLVVRAAQFALSRGDARMFASMDLSTSLADGVTLAVGVRNSSDKSFPLGFCAGSRVFVCDNLAFRSELLVRRKHTRNGSERFREAIAQAVGSLEPFRQAEVVRIERMRTAEIADERAESLLLRCYERGLVSYRQLPQAIRQWRTPDHDEFRPRTLWSLYNALTGVLAPRVRTNPQQFATLTMGLGGLIDTALPCPVLEPTGAGDPAENAAGLDVPVRELAVA